MRERRDGPVVRSAGGKTEGRVGHNTASSEGTPCHVPLPGFNKR